MERASGIEGNTERTSDQKLSERDDFLQDEDITTEGGTRVVLIVFLIVLLSCLVAVAILFFNAYTKPAIVDSPEQWALPARGVTPSIPVTDIQTARNDTNVATIALEVVWQPAVQLPKLSLFADDYYHASTSERYFTVGTISAPPQYQNCDLVIAQAYAEELPPGPYGAYFAHCEGRYTLLTHAHPEYEVYAPWFQSDMIADASVTIPSLVEHFGDIRRNGAVFGVAEGGSSLLHYTDDSSISLSTRMGKEVSFAFEYKGKQVYADSAGNYFVLSPDEFWYWTYRQRINFVRAGYNGGRPEGLNVTFSQTAPAENIQPVIEWVDGTIINNDEVVTTDAVYYNGYAGYGIPEHFCATGLSRSTSTVAVSDLRVAGRTVGTHETVYEIASTSPFMHELYEDYVSAQVYINQLFNEDAAILVYEEFVADHPVFFWIDPLGSSNQFVRSDLVPTACEKGKPVIYLYPPSTTEVTVKLDPKGGFSTTSPLYEEGWFVEAQPDGRLTDLKTGNRFPYLFWEAPGWPYTDPDKGSVVAAGSIDDFLEQSLTELGLSTQERTDFLEFWSPRFDGAPYYLISFFGNDVMNSEAPLSIEPEPDTLIRVFMYYRPLAEPIDIEPQRFITPERTGFTVVEWGGVL